MDGICTLGNDYVYDQVVALLNSIEAVLGSDFPVCIYPYDERTSQLAAFIADRPQVQIYQDSVSMEKWDRFAKRAWDTHPTAFQRWEAAGNNGYYRFGTHRRYCAFDGPFDRFLYMDADTLLLKDIQFIFEQLEQSDCVVYDFQHKDLTHVYDVNSEKLTQVFPQTRLETEIFCSGFHASKRDFFPAETREQLIESLQSGDAEVLYPMAPDQTLLNYMMMKSGAKICNFALTLPKEQKTGNSATSPHFVWRDKTLYDHDKPLTYLHYIGISSKVFKKVCAGENLDFPYREVFLHYRYLHNPQKCPQFSGKPKPYNAPPNLMQRALKKLGLTTQ
ncbi:hypothetical protein PN462_12200 [Spirulina sp. CS-785/01]|uniref:Npun_R2821/Npun_R2822 family protein n=1 Tax=Spirulina sp. CS-785/01 TaxID=3021716 RepID=UPI00232FEFF6|nr:Npun_R2821/Npun_R2822 family protein [Spirulina sp. CS-785/01]MDB9313865.1 hypothetical protein [Spirulina sp. CS-785/01]